MTAFVGINQGVELAIKAFDLLEGAYEGTVGKVLEIAGEVEEFVRISGDAPENMSLLRIEAEKADVPFDDLYKAMENLNKNGVAPTIDNLVAIAQEYVNLQDPIAQAQFLTENFGSAGDEIAPMLEAIAGGAEAVQDVGPIFTEEDLQAARDHEEAVANLKLAWDDFATTIGQKVIPVLTNMFNQIADSSAISDLREQLNGVAQAARDAGIITRTEYNNIMLEAYSRSKTTGEAIEYLETTVGNLTSSLDDNASATNGATQANGYLVRSILANSTSWRGFQQDMEAAGLSMGGMTEASYNAEKGIAASGEAASEAAGSVDELASAALAAAEAQAKLDTEMYKVIANLGERYTPLLADITEYESDIVELQGIIEQGGGMFDGQTISAEEAAKKILELETAIENAKLAMEGLAAQAVAGIAWGQITADAQVSLEEITKYYDYLVASGIMTAEAGQQAIRDFMEFWGLWDPEAKPLPVETVLDSSESDNYEPPTKKLLVQATLDNDEVLNWNPPTKTGVVNYQIGYMPVNPNTRAAGGVINAAAGVAAGLSHYWVGERGPEPFFPSVDGRIMSNTQAMSALRGGAGVNSREIANAVRDGVKDAMRETKAGNVYNLTMPTSNNPADVRTAFELMEAWA
jgi:hypothetical protein